MYEQVLESRLSAHERITQFAFALQTQFRTRCPRSELDGTVALIASGIVGYWITNFIDICYSRWSFSERVSALQDDTVEDVRALMSAVALRSMFDLNDAAQDTEWNARLSRIFNWYRNDPVAFEDSSAVSESQRRLQAIDRSHEAFRGIVLTRTYMPRRAEALVALMKGLRVTRWKEPRIEHLPYMLELRKDLDFQPRLAEPGSFEHFVRCLLPYALPQSVVEDFDNYREAIVRQRRPTPEAVFTANLHVSSDSFVIWMAHIREFGAKLILSQHGGLNGQGLIPTRGEEYELQIADRYLNWGWVDQPNSHVVPAQITMWRKRRKPGTSNKRKEFLLVTDCTYRFSRRPWSDISDGDRYREMLISLYRSLSVEIQQDILVRLHHDHSRYDLSHVVMWRSNFSNVRIDGGVCNINRLRRRARLVLCTTLGTSEIEQFAQSIPTVLRLDPLLHALRSSCKDLFAELEKVGIVHWSDDSLSCFLADNYDDIDHWWSSEDVQSAVDAYLRRFGHQSSQPLRDFRKVLVRPFS